MTNGKRSEEAWVEILVRSPRFWSVIRNNTPPVAESSEWEMWQGATLSGALSATDDFDAIDQLAFRVMRPPSNGQLKLNVRGFEYTPRGDFWGVDFFSFEVSKCRCAEGIVARNSRLLRAVDSSERGLPPPPPPF